MKLHEINDEIAKACGMRTKQVLAVQKETFRRLREILEKGERVTIPGLGSFMTRERPAPEGGEATKSIRFRLQTAVTADVSDEERKARRQAKMAKKAAGEGGAGEATAAAAGDKAANGADEEGNARRQAKKAKKADVEGGEDAAAVTAEKPN